MGRFGWRSGYLRAQNIQSTSVDITGDANQTVSTTVTYPEPLKGSDPQIQLTLDGAESVYYTSKGAKQCTVEVDGLADGTTRTVDVLIVDEPDYRA